MAPELSGLSRGRRRAAIRVLAIVAVGILVIHLFVPVLFVGNAYASPWAAYTGGWGRAELLTGAASVCLVVFGLVAISLRVSLKGGGAAMLVAAAAYKLDAFVELFHAYGWRAALQDPSRSSVIHVPGIGRAYIAFALDLALAGCVAVAGLIAMRMGDAERRATMARTPTGLS